MQREAIEDLLQRSGRSSLPLRRAFVQKRAPNDGGRRRGPGLGPGPLAAFGKRETALDLYLLCHALVSKEPWDVTLPARVWARLTGASETDSGVQSMSRQWSWLEDQQLIRTSRDGRHRRVVLLHDDGSGRNYRHPGLGQAGNAPDGDYFQVPYAYWRMAYDERLSMSGKLVLLIALSLTDDFILPVEHAAKWYGLSATRIHNGLRQLQAFDLLTMRVQSRPARLTERGVTFDRYYSLSGPMRPLEADSL